MKSFAAVLLAAGLLDATIAWWGTGHLLVARSAYDILQDEAPNALAAAEVELQPLKKYYSSITKDEDNYPFVECATFADNIKGQGYSWQSDWHFIDQPYLDQGGSLDDFDFTMPDYIVTDAITGLTSYLRDGDDSSYYAQYIKSHFSYDEDARSFALRLVIHYIGDLHQPLHATSLVDSDYSSGDRGGNSEKLPSICGAYNLHSVWDSVIYNFCGYPVLPFTTSTWNSLEDDVANLVDNYDVPSSDYAQNDIAQWAAESLELSETVVYPGVVVGEALTDEYLAKAEPVAEKRIVYGGRRLAEQIKYIYGSNSAETLIQ